MFSLPDVRLVAAFDEAVILWEATKGPDDVLFSSSGLISAKVRILETAELTADWFEVWAVVFDAII